MSTTKILEKRLSELPEAELWLVFMAIKTLEGIKDFRKSGGHYNNTVYFCNMIQKILFNIAEYNPNDVYYRQTAENLNSVFAKLIKNISTDGTTTLSRDLATKCFYKPKISRIRIIKSCVTKEMRRRFIE